MEQTLSRAHIDHAVMTVHERVRSAVPTFGPPPHRFINDFLAFLGWHREDYNKFLTLRAEWSYASSAALVANPVELAAKSDKIPRFSHKIWVTSQEHPHLPPERFLEAYCENIRSFPADWAHFFWTNCNTVRGYVAQHTKQANVSVIICDIADLPADKPLETAERLIAARKFVLSTDVLRIVIINRFGGIYSDLGISLRTVMHEILTLHDYCMVMVTDLFFQSSVIAASAHSDLLSAFLAVISNPEAFDRRYAVGPPETVLDSMHEVEIFAGLGWTACIILFLPETVRQAYVFAGGEIEWKGLQSWYADGGKLGNVVIHNTLVTVVEDYKFAALTQVMTSSVIAEAAIEPLLREKLAILIKVGCYFTTNPTRLCTLLARYGSDKVFFGHNYGYIYNYLFLNFVDQGASLLEFSWELPSNPEAPQGGTLRAWSEYLRNASIVGIGSLTDPVLNAAIKYVHLDQTDVTAIVDVAMNVGKQRFDIIIEDGRSPIVPNFSVIEIFLPSVKEGGYYVIENICRASREAWEGYLRRSALAFIILDVSFDGGAEDNCIAIIAR